FSAGNDREKFANTLYSPLTNSPYVTVVAAANADGTVSSYSTPGPNVLVAAPGSGNGLYTGRANEVPSIV
ncbi:S8 family serine peptidase, partial [Escherichia coli]